MIVRLIQVYANNIVLTLKIRLFLYKIALNCLLSPFSLMLFIHFYKIFFFTFFVFPYIIKHALNITKAIKKISVNEIRGIVIRNRYELLDISIFMLFFHLYKIFLFTFWVFLYKTMYTLNTTKAIENEISQ